jgi:hypothetical protein
MTQQNVFTRDLAEAARVEAAMADERAQYVALFERMFLALGADVIKIAEGTRHDAELAEARGLAAHRWNQLLSMEAQVEREEQQLVERPKQRPPQPADDLLPDRTVEQRNAEWQTETKNRGVGIADMREQAKRERKELETYIVKSRR